MDVLRGLVSPEGPLGAVLSPADVYKERAGLPIAAPHVARVELPRSPATVAAIEAAPPRFVSMDEAVSVPRDRVRQVSAFVEEHWAPVYATTDSTDIATILMTSQRQVGWTVTQRQSASSRARRYQSAEEFAEIAETLQIQASDAFYDGYYETVPGNDPLVIDGEIVRGEATYDANGKMTHDGIVRGGTQIRGRTEYAAKTKGMIHWDVGHVKERMAAQAEMDSRPARNTKANLERVAGEVLPMRRILANPRVDRRSAV